MSDSSSSGGSANVYRVVQVYSDSYTASQVDARSTPLSGSTTTTSTTSATQATGGSQVDPNRVSSLLLSVDYLLAYGSLTDEQKRYLEEVRQTLLSALQGETSLPSSYIQGVESRIAQWRVLPGDVVNASDVDALGRVVSRLYASGVFDDASLARMRSVVPPPDSSGAWFWDSLAKDPSSFQKALNAVRAWVAQLASNALALATLEYKSLEKASPLDMHASMVYAQKLQQLESDIAFLASVVANASSASPQTLLLTVDKVINLYLTYKSAPLNGEDYVSYLSQLYAKAAEKQGDGKLRDALQDMSRQLAGMTRDRARDLLVRFFLVMDFTPSDVYNQIMGSSRSQLQALAKFASGQPMTQDEIEQAVAGYLMLDAMDKQGRLDTSKLLTPPPPGQVALNPLQGLISSKTFTDAASALSEIESYIARGELPPRRELGLLPVSEALGFADVLGKIQQSVYNGFIWLATKLGMKPEEAMPGAMTAAGIASVALLTLLNFVPGGQFIDAGLIALNIGNALAQVGALAQTPEGRELLWKAFSDPYVLASIAVSALAGALAGAVLSGTLGPYQEVVRMKITNWVKGKLGVTETPQYAQGFYAPTEVKYELVIDPETQSIGIKNDITGEIYSFETYKLDDLKAVLVKDESLKGMVETLVGELAKKGVKPDELPTILATLNNIAKNGPDALKETVTWINQALEKGEGVFSASLYAGKVLSLDVKGNILVFTGDNVYTISSDTLKALKDSLDAVGLYKVVRLLDIDEQEAVKALATATRMEKTAELNATLDGKTVKLLFTPDKEQSGLVDVWVENPSGVKMLLMKVASSPDDLLKVAQIYKSLAQGIGEDAATIVFDSVMQLYSQQSPYISSLLLTYPVRETGIQADLLFNLPGKEARELLETGRVKIGASEMGVGPNGYYIVNMQLAKTPSGNPMDIFYGESAHVGVDKTGGVINRSVINLVKLSPEDFDNVAGYILKALGGRSLSSVPMELVSGSPEEVASIIDDAIRLASASGDQSAIQYLMLLKTASALQGLQQGGVVGFLFQPQGATIALAMPAGLVSAVESASGSLLNALQLYKTLGDQSYLGTAVDTALSQVESALVQSGFPQDEALVLAQQVTRELLKPYNINVVFLPAQPVYIEREVEVPVNEYKSAVEIAPPPALKGKAITIQQPEIHEEIREVEVPVIDYKVIQEYVEPLEYRGRAITIQKPEVVTQPVEVEVSQDEYKSTVDYTTLQMTGEVVYVPVEVTMPVVQVETVDIVEETALEENENKASPTPTPTVTPAPTPGPIPPFAPFTGGPATGGQPPPKGRRQLEELII